MLHHTVTEMLGLIKNVGNSTELLKTTERKSEIDWKERIKNSGGNSELTE